MANILTADIGGTNSRFACFEVMAGSLKLKQSIWLPTQKMTSFSHLVQVLSQTDFALHLHDCDQAVLAVAGPIEQGGTYCKITNACWDIDLKQTCLPECKNATLINDFAAQAYACRTEAVNESDIIQKGRIIPESPLAAIGAGTGLGHCALMPIGSDFIHIPSEAGHAAFAMTSEEEYEFSRFACNKISVPYAYGDIIVTGIGLSLLHEYLTGKRMDAGEVAAQIGHDSQTTAWYARFYGRACRQYSLNIMARGGVYICGGIAAKNPVLVQHPEFLKEFQNSPSYHRLLCQIPIFLVTDQNSGLLGAALYAKQLLQKNKEII